MKEKIATFLDSRGLGTIATVNNSGAPEAAYVAFSNDQDLKLFFGTSKKSRKYQNIVTNSKVAIVIADLQGEIQYEGIAREIIDTDFRREVEKRHLDKVPGAAKFASDPEQTYFVVTPTWLRFIQHGEVDVVEEMTEF